MASNLYIHSMQWRPVTGLKEINAVKKLAPAAFIGNYWHSYLLGIADPRAIAATPRQEDFCRSPELLKRVLTHDTVYFVRNDWMEVFPDSIEQHGHLWIKAGDGFRLDPFDMAPYAKRK